MPFDADAVWSSLKTDERGLVVCVVQHPHSGQVLMVGYMNRDALEATAATGHVTFFSRSRQTLWEKGESSGNTLELVEVRTDCDRDALLVHAIPRGPTCHTGTASCFFAPALPQGRHDDGPRGNAVDRVFGVILDRQAGRGTTNTQGKSYVRSLLDKGVEKIAAKITEEAGELIEAMRGEEPARVVSEAADLVFHTMVGLAAREVAWADVSAEFSRRFGRSGVDEKASRS
ncbi:MAG: bifunctional phosphoribosyl-AMP cyclohydrolase/phosphoribosyl-ATP diphosphatase HisIE [Nannocystaceae bacterium]|nr:bifunctional phosphoribosyl-AMP cyclohydrolase/phosphoribosyl-ATP diphosphatase HisIE [Nannocystaceae bacterium]